MRLVGPFHLLVPKKIIDASENTKALRLQHRGEAFGRAVMKFRK